MSSLRSEFSKLKKIGSLQSILQAACDLIEPEMLWVRSKNANRKLEAIVEAMDENIENKWLFLLENYHNSLGIKGFSHNCISSLRTASFYSTGTYAQPCTKTIFGEDFWGMATKLAFENWKCPTFYIPDLPKLPYKISKNPMIGFLGCKNLLYSSDLQWNSTTITTLISRSLLWLRLVWDHFFLFSYSWLLDFRWIIDKFPLFGYFQSVLTHTTDL